MRENVVESESEAQVYRVEPRGVYINPSCLRSCPYGSTVLTNCLAAVGIPHLLDALAVGTENTLESASASRKSSLETFCS